MTVAQPSSILPVATPITSMVIGVDAHAETFTAVAVQGQQQLWARQFKNNAAGYAACLAACGNPVELVFAVENVKAHALSLVLFLLQHEQIVYDLPPAQVAHLRAKRGQGKTDEQDALHAAMMFMATRQQRQPVTLPADTLELQTLERARAELVSKRVATEAQVKALSANPYASKAATAAFLAIITVLKEQIRALEREIAQHIKSFTKLTEIVGVGKVMAAVLIGETLSMQRFPTEAQFASFCGAAPRDHSSGKTQRVRVNPGGNRRLNGALEIITRVRLQRDPLTKAYFDRKRSEGMAARTAFRATKRQVCKLVYRTLCITLT